MKNKSSLKTRIRELFPCVVNSITTPVHNPYNEVQLTPKSLMFAFSRKDKPAVFSIFWEENLSNFSA